MGPLDEPEMGSMTKVPPKEVETDRLAGQLLEAGRASATEEDLKMKVEPLLRRAFKQIGINVEIAGYERGHTLGGRSDAVYGYVVIEYERPGKLSQAPGLKSAVEDLRRNFTGEAQGHAPPEAFLEKAIGVALDGRHIAFVRYATAERSVSLPLPIGPDESDLFPGAPRRDGFQVLGPYPITAESVANFLIFARARARKPLTAEALAASFGPGDAVARQAVAEIYTSLMRAQRASSSSRAKVFFQEWERIFGAVYGLELAKAGKATEVTAALYQMPGGVRLQNLLFSIHTYYALLMKMISIELLSMQRDRTIESFVAGLGAAGDDEFKARLARMEAGLDFVNRGITNFLEADFFSWYLDEWRPGLVGAVRAVARSLAEFEPATPVLEPDWTRDLLQKLYEGIVPHELRHGLGEYYTPDWLAGHLVNLSGYDGTAGRRFLDPACGSGTFLVQAIQRARSKMASGKPADLAGCGRNILDNIVGFDLNPLAVMAARTNYLIAFARFIRHVKEISIPVYLCDSVVPPDADGPRDGELSLERPLVFRTTKHDYEFPVSMKDRTRIDRFTGLVDVGLKAGMDPTAFSRRLAKELSATAPERAMLEKVYAKIKELQDANEDGIWARYIKNAFAPMYIGKFDFVIGNPPWIRWGYLADEYRKRTLPQWHEYGLFSLKGQEARLGSGEKDFSMLFTYACADRYVKDGGVLAFLITLEVFKSKGAGEGFRRFRIGQTGAQLGVTLVQDLVHLQPFQAANKTCLFVLHKGTQTAFPVQVVEWTRKKGVGKIPPEWTLAKVEQATVRRSLLARPVDSKSPVSAWQTETAAGLKSAGKMQGVNPYRAFRGASTEPYGVFWLHLREVRPDGKLVVENMHDRGKREIEPSGPVAVEPELVYPAVSGRELIPFGIGQPFYILLSQDPKNRVPWGQDWMVDHAPMSLGYLRMYRAVLLSRGSRTVRELAEKTEFYAMFGVGEYSLSPYRVAWKRMTNRMAASVLAKYKTPFGSKTVVGTDTTSFIPTDDKAEAHYLCAILNSEAVNRFISSFSEAGRGFGAPSVVKNLGIPKFKASDKVHRRLANLSEEAHSLVASGKPIVEVVREINQTVEALWTTKS